MARLPGTSSGFKALSTALFAVAAALSCETRATAGWQKPPAPPVSEPFPGYERYVPYEDVLDHCEVALTGKIAGRQPYKAGTTMENPGSPGIVKVTVFSVLKGHYTNSTVSIVHTSGDLPDIEKSADEQVFLCLRTADPRSLRLAGEPPNGGGHITEGPAHLKCLVEAAGDPLKGYSSTNFPVKLSSACRLAEKWAATPSKQRGSAPDGLVETLLEGLWAYKYGLSKHADTAACYGINALFDCDVLEIWNYPPQMKRGRRSTLATDVAEAWQRTCEAVRQRRAEAAGFTGPRTAEARAEIDTLIKQLADENYPVRQAAREALVKIGKPALPQVRQAQSSGDGSIAEGSRLVEMLIGNLRDFRPEPRSFLFDLDRSEPFVK
jgi:hypothetical protein